MEKISCFFGVEVLGSGAECLQTIQQVWNEFETVCLNARPRWRGWPDSLVFGCVELSGI